MNGNPPLPGPHAVNARRWLHISVVSMAFALPWWPAVLPVLIVLLSISALLTPRAPVRTVRWDSPLPWMGLLYGWHVLGMIWSDDLAFGWMDLGMKLSMLVFPLIAWLRPGLDAWTVSRTLKVFVLTCAVFTLFLLVRATVLFGIEQVHRMNGLPMEGLPYTNHFIYSDLTWYVHPSYFASYLMMALAAWTLTDLYRRSRAWMSNGVAVILLLGIVLCSSKMGWIVLAVLLPYILVVRWHDRRLRRSLLVLGLFTGSAFGVAYAAIPSVRLKVSYALEALRKEDSGTDESSGMRRLVWHAASDLIARSPWLGTGTGDVKNELVRTYGEKGFREPFELRLNAHSQLLQTQVALGVVGTFLILGALLVPLVMAVRRRDHLLIVLLLSALMNWSVESMLEVQAGIVYFMFFSLVLTWRKASEEGEEAPRIVVLTQYFPPEIGAPQNRLFAMARQLQRHGARVTVLTAMPNYPDMRVHEAYRGRSLMAEAMDDVHVLRAWIWVSTRRNILWRLVNYFSFVLTSLFAGLFTLGRTDVLVVESPPLFLGLSAMALARWKGAKLVFNVSDLWPESAVQLGLVTSPWMIAASTKLEMACYRSSALISGQTMGIVDNIRTRCPEKPVVWVPNGVDPSVIAGVVATERADHDLPKEALVLCYAGIIGHAQGLEVVLRAAARLRGSRALFLLVGDGPERTRLMQEAAAASLENVRFIDPMPREQVLALVATCDAAVVPLRNNALFKGAIPSKIFEALALSRPVLLGVDGEARKLFIQDGQAGLYFTPEDDAALAAAVRRMLEEPGLVAQLGSNGARYVREHFDRDRIGDRFWEALQALPAR